VNPNVILPFVTSLLCVVFFVLLLDQWRERRRPYQAIWAAGMLWYALGAGTEWIGGAFGWSEPLYKTWYLTGAIWVAGWLGLGTTYLLARTRFGYAVAASLLLAGLFTYLTQQRYQYPDGGVAALLYLLVAIALALGTLVLSVRGSARWPAPVALGILAGTVASAAAVAAVQLPPPGWALDPVTQIPTGELFPGYIRLLTPLFNVTGAFALSLGALYSAYAFMPKRRVMRDRLRRGEGAGPFLADLVLVPVGIAVNFVASIPGALRALLDRTLDSRVPATILIAAGGFVPAVTSGISRSGSTSLFFVGELAGVVLLLAGFLVSADVFRQVRVPFTGVVLWRREEREP
jgi:hypothetical protein